MIKIVGKKYLPPGFVGFAVEGAGLFDTHYFVLTDTGTLIDLGRPRDLFPAFKWEDVDRDSRRDAFVTHFTF